MNMICDKSSLFAWQYLYNYSGGPKFIAKTNYHKYPAYKITRLLEDNAKIKVGYTSSVVKSWSLITLQSGSKNDMDVIEPSISKGFSDHTNSEALTSFRRTVVPSVYLADQQRQPILP